MDLKYDANSDPDPACDYSYNWIQFLNWTGTIVIVLIGIVPDSVWPSILLQICRYGRLGMSKVKSNSFINRIAVPKRWFSHFYLFAFSFQAAVLWTILNSYGNAESHAFNLSSQLLNQTLCVVTGGNRQETVDETTTVLVATLFLIHALRRFYETVFVSVFSNTKMGFFMYLTTFGYYFTVILSLVAHSPLYSQKSGNLPGSSSGSGISWMDLTLRHCVGTLIVVYGLYEQFKAHLIFANLRTDKDGKKIVSYAHQIPQGRLFDLVSSPNYWAEIVIYAGFTVILNFQNPTWNSVAAICVSNQVLFGVMNHRWYLATFPDYPKDRKAIIPYVL